MELFKNTSFDFLGKRRIFIGLSLVLTMAGLASLVAKGGPRYGIEFQGGALMNIAWPGAPPVARIRAALARQLPDATVSAARDLSGAHELMISTPVSAAVTPEDARGHITAALAAIDGRSSVRGYELIGPQIGADLRHGAVAACAWASAGMLAYLAWRFEWSCGVAAVTAVLHDLLITMGLFSLLDQEISLSVVAALLTLIGYSMNDTIVVFDRIRENRLLQRGASFPDLVNLSINQTLSRTVLTSGLTLLTALSLLWFGGPVLRGFSLALVLGIVVGTYSSVFIASPILVAWEGRKGGSR